VKDLLARQVNSPVRWIEEMEKMIAAGVDRALEVGPGKVLCGLMRKISRDVDMKNIENLETLKDLSATL
jgi:[acyl-carrier-protein] S-malonyltransferase